MPRHRQVPWNAVLLDEFIKLAMLNEEEIYIMKARLKGDSRVKISMDLNVSIPTLDRKISILKKKYDDAQKSSDILPVRVLQ